MRLEQQDEAELRRRRDIEILIQRAAQWGWRQAKSGAFTDDPPWARVQWGEDGSPLIVGGTTDPAYAVEPPRKRFEIYKDGVGNYRFRVKARNGEMLGVSPAHPTQDAARAATDALATAEGEVYQDAAGKYRFRVKARNGEIIALGEAYSTEAEAERRLRALLR